VRQRCHDHIHGDQRHRQRRSVRAPLAHRAPTDAGRGAAMRLHRRADPDQHDGVQDHQTHGGRTLVGMLSADRQPHRAERDQHDRRREQRQPWRAEVQAPLRLQLGPFQQPRRCAGIQPARVQSSVSALSVSISRSSAQVCATNSATFCCPPGTGLAWLALHARRAQSSGAAATFSGHWSLAADRRGRCDARPGISRLDFVEQTVV
jgi:hypothetical protein